MREYEREPNKFGKDVKKSDEKVVNYDWKSYKYYLVM